jgi:uncharacterized linocin/CFP29 family protein
MNGNLGRDKIWNQQIWDDIDNAVRDEVGRIRVAQKVFPCTLLSDGQQVPRDELSPNVTDILKIEEGQTKPFVEIWVEFSLTQSQVDNEENLHMGRTLARVAANKIASKEDILLFQGSKASAEAAAVAIAAVEKAAVDARAKRLRAVDKRLNAVRLQADPRAAEAAREAEEAEAEAEYAARKEIEAEAKVIGRAPLTPLVKDKNGESLGKGLLGPEPGEDGAHHDLDVDLAAADPTIATGLVKKVFDGIAHLNEEAHTGPYALFLSPPEFATSWSKTLPATTVTVAERITSVITGGFLATGSLPEKTGLLVSLGGEPTMIYMGIDATTAFTQIESNGIYRFRVFERIQFVIRDPKAFVRLKFV